MSDEAGAHHRLSFYIHRLRELGLEEAAQISTVWKPAEVSASATPEKPANPTEGLRLLPPADPSTLTGKTQILLSEILLLKEGLADGGSGVSPESSVLEGCTVTALEDLLSPCFPLGAATPSAMALRDVLNVHITNHVDTSTACSVLPNASLESLRSCQSRGLDRQPDNVARHCLERPCVRAGVPTAARSSARVAAIKPDCYAIGPRTAVLRKWVASESLTIPARGPLISGSADAPQVPPLTATVVTSAVQCLSTALWGVYGAAAAASAALPRINPVRSPPHLDQCDGEEPSSKRPRFSLSGTSALSGPWTATCNPDAAGSGTSNLTDNIDSFVPTAATIRSLTMALQPTAEPSSFNLRRTSVGVCPAPLNAEQSLLFVWKACGATMDPASALSPTSLADAQSVLSPMTPSSTSGFPQSPADASDMDVQMRILAEWAEDSAVVGSNHAAGCLGYVTGCVEACRCMVLKFAACGTELPLSGIPSNFPSSYENLPLVLTEIGALPCSGAALRKIGLRTLLSGLSSTDGTLAAAVATVARESVDSVKEISGLTSKVTAITDKILSPLQHPPTVEGLSNPNPRVRLDSIRAVTDVALEVGRTVLPLIDLQESDAKLKHFFRATLLALHAEKKVVQRETLLLQQKLLTEHFRTDRSVPTSDRATHYELQISATNALLACCLCKSASYDRIVLDHTRRTTRRQCTHLFCGDCLAGLFDQSTSRGRKNLRQASCPLCGNAFTEDCVHMVY